MAMHGQEMEILDETPEEIAARHAARTTLHEQWVKWFRDSEDSSETARKSSEKDRDYYDGIQRTSEEVTTLKARGQPDGVFNRIAPKVDYLLGAERQQRTQPKVMPRNPSDQAAADAATEALRFVVLNNEFDKVRSEVNENLIIEGSGFAEVIAKPSTKGTIEVKITGIPWDRFFYDPYARRRDFEDARYRGQIIWKDRDEALRMWPGSEDLLETTWREAKSEDTYADKPTVWIDTNRNRVRVVEIWYREDGRIFRGVFTRGGILEGPDESPYRDESGVLEDPYICMSPKINRQGHRYGVVRPLLAIQDEINKRRSKALHLLSVRQVQSEKGAVEDVNKARKELARPDGWIETLPGLQFQVLDTNDMAASQFNLLQEAKSEIDAVGANAALQGKGGERDSGRAIQVRQQGGQMELGPVFDALRDWQKRTYRKAWNRIHQFWTDERAIRVTDNPESPKWIVLNRPVTMRDELMSQFGGQLPPEYAADPRLDEIVRRENDLAQLDVDIIIGDSPDYATLKQEQFGTLAELAKSGVQLNSPEGKALLKLSGVPEVDEIIKLLEGTPEEQQKRAQEQEQQMRIQIEDAISKIKEREAKTEKAVEDADKSSASADLDRAKVMQILAELQSGGPPTVAG